MPSLYQASLRDFLSAPDDEIIGSLTLGHARAGFQHKLSDATLTWFADVRHLRTALATLHAQAPQTASWTVLLEFEIPRKLKRIDVVLLAGDTIILLEQKSAPATQEARLQAEEYALLLHYFHRPSRRRKIIPLVLSPHSSREGSTRQQELAFTETAAFWIAPTARLAWPDLVENLLYFAVVPPAALPIDGAAWNAGEYFPVPSIIEAARTLQSGLSIREIAHSRAAQHDVDGLTDYIKSCVQRAQSEGKFTICFVTGVPGSGKTLVGLNLAFSSRADGDTLSFMSGNGPLVAVLQALFADYRQTVEKVAATQAQIHARTLIEKRPSLRQDLHTNHT